MIASFRKPTGERCVIKWTGKTRWVTVTSIAYCHTEADAATGVEQVPEAVINCEACKQAVIAEHGVDIFGKKPIDG